MRSILPLAFVLSVAAAPAAQAQSAEAITLTLESEARERAAAERIATGAIDGTIDEREARRLMLLVDRLRAYQLAAYADDALSPRERNRLELLHRRLERAIARAVSH